MFSGRWCAGAIAMSKAFRHRGRIALPALLMGSCIKESVFGISILGIRDFATAGTQQFVVGDRSLGGQLNL